VVTGANSFRGIVTFIRVHRAHLNAAFGLHWKRHRQLELGETLLLKF
jgi:hypothetical protein